jgi:phosphate transport system protein
MSHLEERMQNDLETIRNSLWTLGEDVERALANAKRILLTHDVALGYQTVLEDNPINRHSRELDRLCHTFIARYLPGAGTLREMASTNRVNVSLERVGDYAVTLCREAMQLERGTIYDRFTTRIDTLADESLAILRDSRQAFRDGNADAAMTLMKTVRRMEAHMDPLYEELFAADDRMDGRTMMAIFVIFNLLKRVADQAKNICDQTVYAVRGIAKVPKIYRFLFLDVAGGNAAQLGVAIGRKLYPESAEFSAAVPGNTGQPVSAELSAFLDQAGLSGEDLEALPLAAAEHDLGEYVVIVSLAGPYTDFVASIPFHSSALDWSLEAGDGLDNLYRQLQVQVSDLVELVTGPLDSQG